MAEDCHYRDRMRPDSDAITQALQSRLERSGQLTEPDCWTAIHVAAPEMIPALCEAVGSEQMAISALLKLAIRYPEAALDVWEAFKSLDDKSRFLYLRGAAF